MPIALFRWTYLVNLLEPVVRQLHSEHVVPRPIICTSASKDIQVIFIQHSGHSPAGYVASRDEDTCGLPVALGLVELDEKADYTIASELFFGLLPEVLSAKKVQRVFCVTRCYLK